MLLLDYSRAFNCINTKILVDKLRYCGCNTAVCQWFESSLTNGSQIVQCTDMWKKQVRSTPIEVFQGVVQGSVLGPTMYFVYTNDLLENLRYGSAHKYADDTQVLVLLDDAKISNYVHDPNDDLSAVVQ